MKKLYIAFILNLCLLNLAEAQLDSISSYPTITGIGYTHGVCFEINNKENLIIHDLKVALGSQGLHDVDIYYRVGGVQSTPGVPPVITTANGWNLSKRVTFNTPVTGVPVSSGTDLGLILPPGKVGIHVSDPSQNYLLAQRHWKPYLQDTFSNSVHSVRLEMGPNKGYKETSTFPNMDVDTIMFIGGILFETYNPIPHDIGILSVDSPFACCAGTHNVNVRLRNLGANQIDSVVINWTVDNVLQPTFIYSPSIPIDTVGGVNPYVVGVNIGIITLNPNQPRTLKV